LDHEKDPSTPKNKDSMAQRLLNAHLDSKSGHAVPHSDGVVISEAEVTMWGGIIDLSNILPYGTFEVSQSATLQEKLYEELRGVWPDASSPVPSYEVLRHLPYLVSQALYPCPMDERFCSARLIL
jgi:hypothetical protein